ncbi:MAG: hypothetical protein GY940_43640, partial [bacterium]|nr:hypothetical protein [bacterium]
MKKIFTKKKILITLSITILLPILLVILLHTPPIRSAIKNHFQNRLKKQSIDINIGSLNYNLLKPEITLTNITIKKFPPDNNNNTPPFFQAESITLKAPYSSLWNDQPEITLLDIRNPRINIHINPDGTSNIPSPTKESGEEKKENTAPSKLIVHLLQILHCQFSFRDPANNLVVNIPSANIKLNHTKNNLHSLTLQLNQTGHLTYNQKRLPIDTITLESLLDMNRNQLDITKLKAAVNKSSFTFDGHIQNLLSSSTAALKDIALKGTVNLNDLRTFLPAPNPGPGKNFHRFHGSIDLDSMLNGPLNDPQIEMAVKSTDTRDDRSNRISLTGNLQWNRGGLSIPRFLLDWENNGQFQGSAELHPTDWEKGNRIKMKLTAANLRLLRLFTDVPETVTASTASGSVHLEWKEFALASLKGTANLHIQPTFNTTTTGTQALDADPLEAEAILTVDSGHITVDLKGLQLPDLKAAGRFSWQPDAPSPLSGNFQLKTTALNTSLPPSLLEGPLRITGTLGGTIESPTVTATVLNEPYDSIAINGTLKTTAPFPVKVATGFNRFPLDRLLESSTANTTAGDRLSMTVTGTADVRLDLEEPVNTLHIDSRFNNAVIANESFEITNSGPLEITYDPAGITINNMELKGSGIDLETSVQGKLPFETTGINSKDNGLTIRASGDLGLLGKFIPDVTTGGALAMNARITGTISKPQWTGDIRMEKVSFSSPGLPGVLDKGTVKLKVENNQMTIDTFGFNFMDVPFALDRPSRVQWGNNQFIIHGFSISGAENKLLIKGTASPTLDISMDGSIDMKIIDNLMPNIYLYGGNRFNLHITGHTGNPQLQGTIDIKDTGLQVRDPDIFISQVNGLARLEGTRILFQDITGDLNGGTLKIGGEMDFSAESPANKSPVTFTVDNAKFHYPPGLETELSGRLRLKPDSDGVSYLLEGSAGLLQGTYKDVPAYQSETYYYLHPETPDNVVVREKSILDSIKLNITLSTKTPLWVDQALSRSEVTAAVTVAGTAARPGLMGRAGIKKGGVLYFNNRTFSIEQGIVDFNNPEIIEPVIRLTAQTRVSGYDITLQLNGGPESLNPRLSSSPPLPKPDIISLLLTGKVNQLIPDSKMELEESALSLASYFASGIAGEKIKKFSGIDSVRIDTSQEDKEARLTFSERLARQLELVVSQSLKDTQKRSYIIRYDPFRNVGLEAEKSSDNQYGLSFNHHFFFDPGKTNSADKNANGPGKGPEAEPAFKKNPVIQAVHLMGTGKLKKLKEQLRKLMKQREGKRFNYYRFNRDLEAIKRFYRNRHYLGVEIRPERRETNGKVSLVLHITPGPLIHLNFLGANAKVKVPRKVRKEIRDILANGHLAKPAVADALLRLRYYFYKKRYYRADITLKEPEVKQGQKELLFIIRPGSRFNRPNLRFSGNRSLKAGMLSPVFKSKRMVDSIFANPGHVIDSLKHVYIKEGFLENDIRIREIRFDPKTKDVTVEFLIVEGPRYNVGKITFEGNGFISTPRLVKLPGFKSGDTFSPDKYKEAIAKIKSLYLREGFSKCVVTARVEPDKTANRLDIYFSIRENHRGLISEITISGHRVTKKYVILRALAFKKGDTLYTRTINQTRKNLYDLGIFEQVDISASPVMLKSGIDEGPLQRYRVRVRLVEQEPYRLKYG